MTARITTLILEDRAGTWPITVNWIASLRPRRFDHEGRTFDAAGQLADGTWIYRTSQDPPPGPKKVTVWLTAGLGRAKVDEVEIDPGPLPETIEHKGETYRLKTIMALHHHPEYWHG